MRRAAPCVAFAGGSFVAWRHGSRTPAGTARRSGSTSTPTAILEEMTDDLLYHGDLNAALRRMLQSGFRDRNGERLQGLRDMLEKLRRKRKDALEHYDLGGVYDDIAQELRDIVDTERHGARRPDREARESGDQRRQEVTERGGCRAPDAARHAAARPRRHGAGPPGVRLHLERGARAVRAS